MTNSNSNSYWNIDSGHGDELSAGIQLEARARKAAQERANERGESVYLYEVRDGVSLESEEIAPEVNS